MPEPGRQAHPTCPRGARRAGRPLLLAALATALFLLSPLLPRPVGAQQGPDLQVVIISEGTGTDHVAVSYQNEPAPGEVEQDFATLAKELGVPPPKVSVTREKGITAGEARLPGLIQPAAGPVRIDPLIHTFRRFGFFRVTALIMGQYSPPAPGNVTKTGLRVETRVAPNTVDHLVWVDQSQGVPDRVASVTDSGGPEGRTIDLLAFIAVVVALAVFLVVYVMLGQRRAAAARGGES